MVHTSLLKELHGYVDEYVAHVCSGSTLTTADANAELRRIIDELEELQTHPDRLAKLAEVSRHISRQREWLQRSADQPHHAAPSGAKHTLVQALQDYITSEVEYLARVGGAGRRVQTNLLLGDIISDLKTLALHPDDHQALAIARDLESKRTQLTKLQRPWQQQLPDVSGTSS